MKTITNCMSTSTGETIMKTYTYFSLFDALYKRKINRRGVIYDVDWRTLRTKYKRVARCLTTQHSAFPVKNSKTSKRNPRLPQRRVGHRQERPHKRCGFNESTCTVVISSPTAKIEPITHPETFLSLPDQNLTSLPCQAVSLGEFFEPVQMYDTSPLTPFKGETKPFLHVGFDTKTLESLFDLHPSFETSLDLSDFVTGVSSGTSGGGGGGGGVVVAASPPGVPDSAVVTSPVASSPADFVTLSSAATSQHLAEIERQPPGGNPLAVITSSSSGGSGNNNNNNNSSSSSSSGGHHHLPHHQHHHPHHHPHHHHQHQQQHSGGGAPPTHFLTQPPQQMSPGPCSVSSTPSPVSHHPPSHLPLHPHHHHQQQHQQQHHHHHQQQQHQQQQLQGYAAQPVLSPSLSVDDVSQAFSDDSCVFMPEYEQLTTAGGGLAMGPGGGPVVTCSGSAVDQWGAGPDPFYSTVKTEDLGLTSLTNCSLEASLPGFSLSSSSTAANAASATHASSSTTSPSPSSSSCKMEYEGLGAMGGGRGHYSGGMGPISPTRSMRTLSESSSATTSTMPDSPSGGSPRGVGGRGSGSLGEGSASLGKGGAKRRQVPKGSEEYKEKRARNNVAVRKSRAKAKEKQRMTETHVKELTDLNDSLQKKVDTLTKELTVLRRLFANVGTPMPEELTKLMS